MKITDLMIGDYVQYNGQPVRVHALNLSDGYAIMEDQVSIELSKDTCMSVDAKRLKPIPLTPEILKKNGFIENYDKDWDDYTLTLSIPIKECHLNMEEDDFEQDVYVTIYITFDNESVPGKYLCPEISFLDIFNALPLAYVHELQCLLKYCKIKKEIIVDRRFKN